MPWIFSRWAEPSFIIQLLLMLLPAETDAVLKERCSKKYAIRSFWFGGGKVVFTLLTEIVTGYMVVTSINIWKTCLEETFSRAFCSCKFGFHYCLNDILHFLIWINFWRSFGANRSCCCYVERPLGHCRYIRRPWKCSLSASKFFWASEWQQQPKRGGVNGFGDMTLDPTRASASFKSYQKE